MNKYHGVLELDWQTEPYNEFASIDFVERIKQMKDENIIVWGAAERGIQAIKTIRSIYEDNLFGSIYLVDDDTKKQGKRFCGLEACSFEEVKERINPEQKSLFINTTKNWNSVKQKLLSKKDEKITLINFPGGMTWSELESPQFDDRAFLEKNRAKFCEFYHKLGDEVSRQVLWGILNYRLTRQEEYILQIYQDEKEHYCEKALFGTDHKWFREKERIYVDAGAYDGDTLEQLRELTDGKYKKIICLEAGEEAFTRLKAKAGSDKRVDSRCCALWSQKEEMVFDKQFVGSKSNRVCMGGV